MMKRLQTTTQIAYEIDKNVKPELILHYVRLNTHMDNFVWCKTVYLIWVPVKI